MGGQQLPAGIYKATVRGVPDQIVMLAKHDTWTIGSLDGYNRHARSDITDARPLIVLDPEDIDVATFLDLHMTGTLGRGASVRLAALMAPQVKPPRIEEPGLWGVVEASVAGSTRTIWVRRGPGTYCRWHSPEHGYAIWDILIDPVLIRNGIR